MFVLLSPQRFDNATHDATQTITGDTSGHICLTPTFCLVVNHSSKVLDAELRLVVVFWRDVVRVEFVLEVQLVEHGGVCALRRTQAGRDSDHKVAAQTSCEHTVNVHNVMFLLLSVYVCSMAEVTASVPVVLWGTCSPRR